MGEYVAKVIDATLDEYVQQMVEKNRAELIKAAVPNREIQRELLDLNERIQALKDRDPDVVAAWGLGCGNHCALPEIRGISERR